MGVGMIRYEVTGSYVALHHGRVELTKEQAAPRAYALKHLKGDTYELTAETHFKRGEKFGYDGEVSRALLKELEAQDKDGSPLDIKVEGKQVVATRRQKDAEKPSDKTEKVTA